VLAVASFFSRRFGKRKGCPTKRAADGWESAAFSSIFLTLGFFYISSLFPTRPPAANANRWAAESYSYFFQNKHLEQ
jgi:CDP-diglyceride synthetase